MKYVTLGNSQLKISAMGLGCMGMSEFYGLTNESESLKVIHRALELGVNFFDTADQYGMGANEILLGKALKGKRNQAVIASKCGVKRDPNNVNARVICGEPAYIKEACDASLRRLGVDCIDLYYLHRPDRNTPIEETVGAMAELVKAGKIRSIGLSEASVETITRAHKTHPISALQTEYSLWSRDPEQELLPLCEKLGITFVAYSPLGRGFLTGKITSPTHLESDDYRRHLPRFKEENITTNMKLVEAVTDIANKKNCTVAQLMLAWVMSHTDNIVPIPGTKNLKYLEENIAAAEIILTKNDMESMENISQKHAIIGTRYHEFGMALVNL